MIEIFAPPPPIMVGLNEHELVQISLAIFCTLILVFVDIAHLSRGAQL